MNFRRLALAALAAWVVFCAMGPIVKVVLFDSLYAEHAAVMRPSGEANPLFALAPALLGFFVFAYAYAKGYEGGSGLQEGLRFGVIVGLLIACFAIVPVWLIFPVSATLAAAWIVDAIVEFAIYGALVGTVYKPVTRSVNP
jgi:hypothetical protein